MSYDQDAYYAQFLTNNTRPPDAIVSAADEQLLSDLALGKPVGKDIHRRYISRAEDHPIIDRYSCHCEGHAERMRYHEQRIAAHQ